MEDGSAAPVEHILIQSGALGFYQKRLFLCSCFLQALTVSALIYASHCRPELQPPAPAAATNGGLAHPPKCPDIVSRSSFGQNRSRTIPHGLPAYNESSAHNETRVLNETIFLNVTEHWYQIETVSVSGSHDDHVGERHGRSTKQLTTDVPDFGTSENVKDYVAGPSVTEQYSASSASNSASNNEQHSSGISNKRRHQRKGRRRHDGNKVGKVEVPVTTSASDSGGASNGLMGGEHDGVAFKHGLRHTSSPDPPRDYHNDKTDSYNPSLQSDVSVSGAAVFSDGGVTVSQDGLATFTGVTTSHSVTSVFTDVTSSDNEFTGEVTAEHVPTSTTRNEARESESTGVPDVRAGKIPDVKHADCTAENQGKGKETPFYVTMTYLPTPEWLNGDQHKVAQYNAYCQAVGAIVGAALGAMGADQVGRRRPLFVYFPLMLIAHCMSGFAMSWTMLAVFRFLVGVFAGATAVVSMVFPLEFIGAEYRDACVCSGIWVVGAVVISLELLVTRHWRYLAFISGGVGLPLIESARWLLCHQRFPDAETTLKEIMSCNSSSVTEFMSLFDKSRACVVTNMHHKRYTFLDLFHSLEMTKWTLALVYTCLVASSVYFCLLAKVKEMTGNMYVDTSLPFVIDLPLGWSAVVVNRCLGRRWCLFLYAVASGLALLSVLVLHMTGNLSHMPSMLTGMAVFGKIGVTASLGLVFVIAVEMYPTVVRCMGVSMGVMAVTGGSLLSEAFDFLEAYHYTVPFVVFGAMMASVGFAGLLFPETLHRPMPNILPCRHRTIPLHEGVRLVTNPWDIV